MLKDKMSDNSVRSEKHCSLRNGNVMVSCETPIIA